MKLLFRSLLVLMSLTLARGVGAQTLTFDELPAPDATIMSQVVCGNVSGFRFASAHFHTLGPGILIDFTNNGSTHIGYESIRGLPIVLDRVDGGTFSLQSLDAGEFYYPVRGDHPNAQYIQITGLVAGGGMVTHQLTLDGISDGAGGVDDYQHFTLPNTFTNLSQVTFTGLIDGGGDGGIALDNIQYLLDTPGTVATCVSTPATPANAPTVTLTNPVPGNVLGTIQFAATASAPAGLSQVQFRVDGVTAGAALTVAPFTVAFDTTTIPDGAHTVSVTATDVNNLTATASVVMTVRNTPITSTDAHFLEFDGIDDYVQVPDTNVLSFGDGASDTPFTFELWFHPDQMVRHRLIGKWGEVANQEYQFQIALGAFRLDLRDSSAGVTVSAFTQSDYPSLVGAWHHVAVSYDGRGGATAADGIAIYLDGVAQSLWRENNAAYEAMDNLADPLIIGRAGPAWWVYDGGLDDIRVWRVARSAAEIQAAMTTELTGSEAGLAAYWRFNEGAGLLVADATVNDLTGTLINGPAWTAGGPLTGPPPDTTPPVISAVTTHGITTSSANVSFLTDEAATATVSYSLTGSCPCTVLNSPSGTTHDVTLSGLAASTQYTFFITATDLASNTATSASFQLTTLTPPDLTAPTVAITAPPAGPVAGTITLSATATDNVGVVTVVFKIDGTAVAAPDLVAPFAVTWDSTSVVDGTHTLTVEARDAALNLGTASRVIDVRNTPLRPLPLAIDFGAGVGLWQYGESNGWQLRHGMSPRVMTEADIDGNGITDLVAVFTGYGIWAHMNGASWLQLHPTDASDVKAADLNGNGTTDLVFTFPGSGLWARYDAGSWTQLHPLSPTKIVVGNIDGGSPARADLVVSFASYGLFAYMNNAAWVQLHSLEAQDLAAGDIDGNGRSDVVVQFAGYGEWIYANNNSWWPLHTTAAAGIVVGNVDGDNGGRAEIVINFPGYGVWVYSNNTSWSQLHPRNVTALALTDLDGNGQVDVATAFAGSGLFVWRNNSSWQHLHPSVPRLMSGGK